MQARPGVPFPAAPCFALMAKANHGCPSETLRCSSNPGPLTGITWDKTLSQGVVIPSYLRDREAAWPGNSGAEAGAVTSSIGERAEAGSLPAVAALGVLVPAVGMDG